MKRIGFYLYTLFYVFFALVSACLMWRDWPNVLGFGLSRLSFIHLAPLLSIVSSYPRYIRSLVEKGELALPLEKVIQWELGSYLAWGLVFLLLAYFSQQALLYLIPLVLLIGFLTSAYQLWESRQHTSENK